MDRPSRRLGSLGVVFGALILLARCGGDDLTLPNSTGPAAISKFGGDNQSGPAGSALALPVQAKVVDRAGAPLSGQQVAFVMATQLAGAEVNPDTATTNSDGVAETSWTLGATSGTQQLVARVVGDGVPDGLQTTFQATVGAAGAGRIAAASGDNQRAAVGTGLPNPLVVLVTDQFGNPVGDVEVDWEAQAGSVDPGISRTGPDGLASTSWVLGTTTGAQTATASSAGLVGSPVTFTATALPGTADRLVRVSGDNQTGHPGEELNQPLVVRLVDRDGNGIGDRPVSWVIGAGGGTVSASSSTTNGNGEAETRWTLGPGEGVNTLNAVVSGVDIVDFRATATSGGGGGGSSAARLEFQVQPSDAERGRDIEPAVVVVVRDQSGNLVTGEDFEIKLELLGDARLRGDEKERTHSGAAIFHDLEVDEEGNYRLRASTDGLPSVDSDEFEIHERSHDD